MPGRWATLKAAAEALGSTVTALRKRAKRGSFKMSRDNSGRLLVWLDDVPSGAQPSQGVPNGNPSQGVPNGNPQAVPMAMHRAIVEGLQAANAAAVAAVLAAHQQQVEELRADHARHISQLRADHQGEVERQRSWWTEQHQGELERLDRRHRDALADLDRRHRATVSLLVEQADAAGCRAEAAEALVEQRRKWWRWR